ncbi:MFS transporter protein [Rutstroemia sp. NJR-2017a BVV2]|nr:MFS transporter protein [Rutstroemia sp. NJR-2017a BVV2]
MKDSCTISLPIGHGWRSSRWFVLMTIAIALFAETFLYGFLVPILGHMLQNRLHVEESQVQTLSSAVLALHGAVAVVFSPIIGHLADKSSSRKKSLLLSLGFCIIGTFMVAGATSVPVLILGRVIQGIAGSAVWIVGFATVTDILSRDAIGFGISLMISFANAGTVTGPVVSGLLIETAGYWVTWSIPLIVLIIDLLARLIMMERPYKMSLSSSDDDTDTDSPDSRGENLEDPPSAGSFWRIMLCDGRVVACLLIVFTSVSVTTSFEATLPFQVQQKFGWSLRAVGLLFAGLVVPGVLIGPFAGWVRDRIGARPPVVVCSIIQAVILGLLGVAGRDIPSGDIPQIDGKLYIASILAIGTLRPFVSGIAPAELADAAKERQEMTPGVFGPQGSVSRVFAMTDVAVSLGMMIGPIMGSSLKAVVGYELMNCAWGLLYLITAVLAFCLLGPRNPHGSLGLSEEAV